MESYNKSSEVLLEELRVESLIRQELKDVVLYFDYSDKDSETSELSLITISISHGERFLFHKISSKSGRLDCLNKMLIYIKSDYKKSFENYEIVWKKKEDKEFCKSWFHGNSILDVIEKFYHGKDTNGIVVLEITLRPMS